MGSDAAYKAVMKPTEGTILTVVRCAAEATEEIAPSTQEPIDVFLAGLEAAKEALAKTPEMLPVLKQAGVVDAGGQGFLLILEGMKSVFINNVIIRPIGEEAITDKNHLQAVRLKADTSANLLSKRNTAQKRAIQSNSVHILKLSAVMLRFTRKTAKSQLRLQVNSLPQLCKLPQNTVNFLT